MAWNNRSNQYDPRWGRGYDDRRDNAVPPAGSAYDRFRANQGHPPPGGGYPGGGHVSHPPPGGGAGGGGGYGGGDRMAGRGAQYNRSNMGGGGGYGRLTEEEKRAREKVRDCDSGITESRSRFVKG